MSLLRIEELSIAFGGVHAVEDLSFEIEAGAIHSIIGPNGAGKTTLFNLITGLYRASRGRILLEDREIGGQPPHLLARCGLSRTFQNPQVFFRMTAIENVMVGRHLHESKNVLAHLLHLPAVVRQNRETRVKAHELLDFVGLGDYADRPAGAMPYGALKRLEIARALAVAPKMLLLDEPAAGCNPVETQEIDRLIQQIARTGVTVVLVEHNMHLVMNISSRILVLDSGRKLAEGTGEEVRANPAVIAAYLGAQGRTERVRAQG